MKISDILKQSGDNFGIKEIISDFDFETLGLVVADLEFEFCTFLDDIKYAELLNNKATMVITTPEISRQINGRGLCISDNPRISFFKLHNYLVKSNEYRLSEEFETIIGRGCSISDLAFISKKNVKIGENVTIEEFVSIKENTVIGNNTFIGAGTIIGGEGYEFKRLPNDEVLSIKHHGWTKIGENVDIQYNVCIDKAIYPWDATIVDNYCKVDNLVHIAHAVKLEQGVFLVAGSLIGGRTVIRRNTWVGVGTTISNGLIIGEDARVNIGAVVTRSMEDKAAVSGNFAIEHKRFIEFIKSIR